MTYEYHEATLDLLRLTIPLYGILVPIIKRSGTDEIIDGRHRMKVRDELAEQGIQIMLPVHHVDTDNPAEIDAIVNSIRRPWVNPEERKKLVKQLREKGHSNQLIANAMGTSKFTVARDLAETPTIANATVGPVAAQATTGKDGKDRKPSAGPQEVARAWSMKESGMSTPAIAFDLGRGEQTIRNWFKKPRPMITTSEPPTTSPPAAEPDPEPEAPSEPEQEPALDPEPIQPEELEPFTLTPSKGKLPPISPGQPQRLQSQTQWIERRWLPAAQQLVAALKVLRPEHTRLGNCWRNEKVGGKVFTQPYQRLAAEWQEKGYLAEIAEALGLEDQSLDAVLLKLQHTAEDCASLANGMRMFTGYRPDNNLHE